MVGRNNRVGLEKKDYLVLFLMETHTGLAWLTV